MKELIIKFEPFILKQTVFVQQNNNIVTQFQVPMKDLTNFISLQDNVYMVHLFGNKKFAEKFKEDYLTKYSTTKIKFCINK